MLSRLANRVYWLSRYMERAGNSAKIASAYANLLFDLPLGTDVGWHTLIAINDAEELFDELYPERNEDNIMNFLLFDDRYPGSIFSSIGYARENARTSRDILPSETWEIINSLYLSTKEVDPCSISRSKRYIFLNTVTHNVMRLEGMLNSGLSRNNTYRFIQLGRNIERADTTTRVLDVGSTLLSETSRSLLKSHEGVVWMNILRSMNAYQMYRQGVKRKVAGEDVVRFMISDACFPRSVVFCVEQIEHFSSTLPKSENITPAVERIVKELEGIASEDVTHAVISKHMDELQVMLADMNNIIEENWFNTNIDI